jgi:molybdenum cofactor biosynthesis enzyme MoaA
VSLDTLNEGNFIRIARWRRLNQLMKGLEAAKETGLRDVKHAWANIVKVSDASASVAGISLKSKGYMA